MLNKKIIENIYNLKIISQNIINSGYINNITILNTKNKKYALKKFIQASIEDIKYEINIINFLVKKEFKTPKIISTKDNKQYVNLDGSYYVLFEYLKPHSSNISSMECAELYSKYNNVMKKFGTIQRANWLTLCDCKWIKNKENKELYPKLFDYLDQCEKKLSLIYSKLPKIVVHGDFKKDNIIKTMDGLHLIDFGNSRVEARGLDIVHIADSLNNKSFSINKISDFLNDLKIYITLNKTEKKSLIYILIIHKITEVFFYHNKNDQKKEKIINDIKILVKNEKKFIKTLTELN